MNVTDALMREHQLILKFIDLLDRYIEAIGDKENSPLMAKANDFIDFIKNFADRFHHMKEEDQLFKFLEAPGVLTHCNPLPQMLMEHDEGRNFVKGMEQAVAKEDAQQFAAHAQDYSYLLKEHINKEDNILYQMAEESLSDAAKKDLQERYEKVEKKMDGEKLWAKYERSLQELEAGLQKV